MDRTLWVDSEPIGSKSVLRAKRPHSSRHSGHLCRWGCTDPRRDHTCSQTPTEWPSSRIWQNSSRAPKICRGPNQSGSSRPLLNRLVVWQSSSRVERGYNSQSVSQWNAWPATGRSALQDLRSCAILQASLALSPVSSSICCTHVRQDRPRWRFHSGLMSGLPPARASTARRSAQWAGVASISRRTWPKMESRLVTEVFVTKWNQRIPKTRRWQFMWNASNHRSSAFKRVYVSEPYNSTEMTRAL